MGLSIPPVVYLAWTEIGGWWNDRAMRRHRELVAKLQAESDVLLTARLRTMVVKFEKAAMLKDADGPHSDH